MKSPLISPLVHIHGFLDMPQHCAAIKKTGMRLQQTVGMGFMTFADTFFFDKKLDNTVTFLMH